MSQCTFIAANVPLAEVRSPHYSTFSINEAAAAGSDAAKRETAFTGAVPARSARRAGSSLLTGKILPKDLKDVRGNVLARAGTVVSREVIRRAMEHGKLFELTLLCANAAFTKF